MTESDHLEMHDELHWLAFRYVAGEMTADEEGRFEAQLADDQGAREAVAQAVELHEAVRLAAATTNGVQLVPAENPVPRRHRLVWATSLAALVTLALGGLVQVLTTPHPPADNGRAGEPGADVARTWAEVRRAQHPESVAADAALLAAPEFGVGDLGETDAQVPNWMMTAFAKQPKQKK
jgi:ferric-dicitrate binding protein FerR (iron transport regulator)